MPTFVVRYRPQPDTVAENRRLVEEVFAELHATDPGGIRYATFKLADGTWVHVADIDGADNPLAATASFAEFTADIEGRCEEGQGPNPQAAEIIGSYRLFD